jgi:outer membrane autotransporter protein
VQFDWTREVLKDSLLSGEISGTGWLAGPYIGIKLYDNIYFDARAAWGTSENDITLGDSAIGTRTGSFDTTRWLATATLTGNYLFAPWRMTPQVGLAFGNEWYDPFKNSLGQTVDGADVSIARLTYGTEVGYRFLFPNGVMLEPHVGIFGIWNFDSDRLLIDGALVVPGESRARIEGGVIVKGPGPLGASARAVISHDGIGDSDFSATTGKIWLNLPLN